MRQSNHNSFISRWGSLIKKLTQVNHLSPDIERRHQQDLLSILSLSLVCFQVLVMPLYIWDVYLENTFVPYVFSTLLFLIVYILNRFGRYLTASYLLVFGLFIILHTSFLTATFILQVFTIHLMVIALIFLTYRMAIAVISISVISQLVLMAYQTETTSINHQDILVIVLFSIPLILIFMKHRTAIEASRQTYLHDLIANLESSEAKWRSLAANSPDLVVQVDPQYRIQFINRINPSYPASAVIGKSVADFILPEYHPQMYQAVDTALHQNKVTEFDGRSVNLDGEEIWFSARVSPILQHDEFVGVIVSSRDVTEQRAAERALSYFQARQVEFQGYLTLLHDIRAQLAVCETLPDFYKKAIILGQEALKFDRIALFVIDEEKQIIQGTYGTDEMGQVRQEKDYAMPLSNPAWRKVIEAEETVIFRHDVDLLDYKDIVGQGWKAIAGLWDGKQIIGFIALDNLITHYAPRPYEEELIAIYASILAQTILHKRNEAHRINLAVQTEKVQLLENLINDLSHDLRTPLTSIHNYLYLLKKQPEPTKTKKHLDALESQINHLTHLVEDILAMARLDKNEEFFFEKLAISYLLETVIPNYRHLASQRQITMTIEHANPAVKVLANRTELARALSNLIENAVNYTLDGGHISISSGVQADELVIKIADNGIGIGKEDLSQIFDRFYRADKARNTIKGGTGLGLAIVKRIVELHHGRLTVESTLGEGSIFSIWLPLEHSSPES